jgi:O-6-methylguanine DNA methyltransferase
MNECLANFPYIGKLIFKEDDGVIVSIEFASEIEYRDIEKQLAKAAEGKDPKKGSELILLGLHTPVIDMACDQIKEYLDGERGTLSFPCRVEGTLFQKQVWEAISKIPYGETRSYSDIAEDIGNPSASRAVGAAANANPLPLIIPCHRVLGSDGDLTGFVAGIDMKELLLRLEKMDR